MRSVICRACGNLHEDRRSNSRFCHKCSIRHYNDMYAANSAIKPHIKKGLIKCASDCLCIDCGKPAKDNDHRDYLQPLVVEPVCRSCNVKRGPAFNSVYRPPGESDSDKEALIAALVKSKRKPSKETA
jgi:hypothetical protein